MTRALLMLMIGLGMVVWVKADYHVGVTISGYSNPNNTLSDGSCCDGNCAAGSCRTTLRLCFRDAGHSHEDVESNCMLQIIRGNSNNLIILVTDQAAINQYYSQQFQVYIRVSHSLNTNTLMADFDPPFTDPLIDNIFIEANVTAVPFTGPPMPETYTDFKGEFGLASITMTINVACAQNYSGAACEMLCDSDGTNCTTVLTPPLPSTTPDITGPTNMTTGSTDQSNPGPTNMPTIGPPGGVVSPTPNVVGIVVGVVVGVAVLTCIGVIIVIFIIFLVKRSKKGSWNPKKSDPHFTLERAERNLTSNINRISIISESGQEVEYAVVSKPNSPARTPRRTPTPPPPYVPPMEGEELDTEDEDGPMEAVRTKAVGSSIVAGYEIMDFPEPKNKEQAPGRETELKYASLNIHSNGNGHVPIIKMPEPKEDDHEPVQYSELQRQDL